MQREFASLLTPLGQPYNPVELHAKYASSSPREAYAMLCKKCKCKSIQAVAMLFPDTPNSWSQVESINIANTYVGPKGVIPVIEMCKLLPNVLSVNFSDNYLNNESVWYLCKVAMFHPSLQSIDVSKNAISWTAAMCLVELVTKNAHITHVYAVSTSIQQNVLDAIQAQVLKNASYGSRKHRRGLNPCNHPTTIRQRALKRYFLDIAGSKQDTVPRERLADGLKEMWKVSGREREVMQRTPLFYDNFNKRASSDRVSWEEFLILIMLEDVQYNALYVEKLRVVFHDFDVDGGGYVEVGELKNLMTRLSPVQTPPSAEELQSKMNFYDLDESMTLTWDEFLLLLYDHGPVVGSKAELTKTPLPALPHPYHN